MPTLVAAALLLLAACGKSDREERDAVISGIERVRAVPSGDHDARRARARELAKIEVKGKRPRAARDACAKAFETSANMIQLLEDLEAEASKPLVRDKELVAADFRTLKTLQAQAADEMDACADATGNLVGPD
ncbi:MAG: hypothetical protein U0271_12150 [Polyangiaceae bacterium]